VTRHVYLVPGFFGFTSLGELGYFTHVIDFLVARLRAEVHVVTTRPTASLPRRAALVVQAMADTMRPGDEAHLVGHSSGGLDVRLAVAPNVALDVPADVERFARAVRTVITVSTPHHGTPLASFFASLLGQRLLELLSLTTMSLLRFGGLPISLLLQVGGVLARLDDVVGLNSVLLDELFEQLLANFTAERRVAVETFLADVGRDQALLPQLTPEGMEVFNASTRDRSGVRYGSVVTRARPPGVLSTLAAGFDPTAQATHAIYQALYRLAARTSIRKAPAVPRAAGRVLRRAYGALPKATDNDGVVPTRSQTWGEVLYAARGDHLDAIGHFGDMAHVPPHVDWLTTGTGFDRDQFEALWGSVAGVIDRSE
jgi:hypothetical protein